MTAKISDVQKLKQKSHSNIREINFGALAITSFLMPNFPISRMINAAAKAMYIIKCIVDIILLLLM